MENIIEVKNLTFCYEEDVKTIDNISFTIKKGSYTTILGHNGSGKSTIAKLLMGLLEKNSGDIYIGGIELTENNLAKVRDQIGIVFQNPDNQFIGSTVRDDIAFGLENNCVDPSLMDSIIEEYAAKVDMLDFLDHEPTKLSGGQKQRVAIAGILAMSPSIIILDEATSMLDPKGRMEINTLVHQLNKDKNMTILSITHDIEEATLSDYVLLMSDGQIIDAGEPNEVLKKQQEIEDIALDVPFAYKVSTGLQKLGIDIDTYINKEKLVNTLCQLHSNK
ncbi:MAG: energy-coupling factor transporter ATPase [Erysipelotrichaceae bacterium]|nr:energy-coupling factor transporter ATPase [Erysipelotrichaceae bacterium]